MQIQINISREDYFKLLLDRWFELYPDDTDIPQKTKLYLCEVDVRNLLGMKEDIKADINFFS